MIDYDTIYNEIGIQIEGRAFLTVPLSSIQEDGSFSRYSIGTAINSQEKSITFIVDASLSKDVEKLIIKNENFNFWLEEKEEGSITLAEETTTEMPVFLSDEIASLSMRNSDLENQNKDMQQKLDTLEGAMLELMENVFVE